LLVTGMSGAGKSNVLDALEDMGWDTVDNLPADLLQGFDPRRRRMPGGAAAVAWTCAAAASIPRRCRADPLLRRRLARILYLDCSGSELMRRYDETARRTRWPRTALPRTGSPASGG
jgi:UPF0042 nucleotide-binding protein